MERIPVVVLTNDNHLWCLEPFNYCFTQFWPKQEIDLYGFARPDFIPRHVYWHSIAQTNYPVERWTDGLIEMLYQLPYKYFVLMLEDYWLARNVDINCVAAMMSYIEQTQLKLSDLGQRILRIDLTADRSSRKQAKPYATYHGYDIISTPPKTPYQMSYQAAIWDRDVLLSILVPGETPWQSEVDGSDRLRNRNDLIVLGTTAYPLYYIPAVRSRKAQVQNLGKMPKHQRDVILKMVRRLGR